MKTPVNLSALKRILPLSLWQTGSRLWYGAQRAAQWPASRFHPWRRTSINRLAHYQALHCGERCFIIGNGPSLKQTDLSLLKGEITFGMNRFYLVFPELGFPTTYYLSVNTLVIEQCISDLMALPLPKFLSWRSRSAFHALNGEMLTPDEQTIFLHTTYTGPLFALDARRRLWEGATVTYIAMQLAYFMGFQQVILIGVDHNFTTQGKPNTTVVSQGDDQDHFHAGYFGKGFRWQLPDLATSERAYRMAKAAYELDGREILDATVGGKLQVFPKVEYPSLFR